GTNRSNSYCGPTGWGTSGQSCAELGVEDAGISHTFALGSGASRYFNIRIQVKNDYLGDQELFNVVSVTGDTGGPDGSVTRTAESVEHVTVQYPDFEITRKLTKITGNPNGPIRAG